MYKLNAQTQADILKRTGLSVEDMRKMDNEAIDSCISKKIGKQLTFGKVRDERRLGRGSVYIALNRLISVEDVNKKLSKI